jgi:membrane protease YdiL (CAAX protease family)
VIVREGTRVASVAEALAPWLVAVVGVSALLLRPRLDLLGPGTHVAALLSVSAAVLAASLAIPVRADADPRRLSRAAVLAIGGAGVLAAAIAGGRPVPVPLAAWALPLSLAAAVAEEALFRRAAYGALASRGALAAVVGTALLFALIHVPLYGIAAFPVDLGAGLLFGWQRWASGTWTVPAATHALANMVAVMAR